MRRSIIAGAIIGGLVLFKDVYSGNKYCLKRHLRDKTIIITGATGSIGQVVSSKLACKGATVILACRDIEKGTTLRKDIQKLSENDNIHVHELDLTKFKSIRSFAQTIQKNFSQVNILINNAAVRQPPPGVTEDGFDLQEATNYLGHFLLTCQLLPILKASAPSRIINVTCDSHKYFSTNKLEESQESPNELNETQNEQMYYYSKLHQVMSTRTLSDKLSDSGITVNSVCPGTTYSSLDRHLLSNLNAFSRNVWLLFKWMVLKSPEYGACSILYAATSPDLEGVTGKYIKNCELSSPSHLAKLKKDNDVLFLKSCKSTMVDPSLPFP